MINEKPQLINEYESGKAIPNPQASCKPSDVASLRAMPVAACLFAYAAAAAAKVLSAFATRLRTADSVQDVASAGRDAKEEPWQEVTGVAFTAVLAYP